MKRASVLLSIVFVLMFAVFALGSGEDTNATTNQGSGSVETTEAVSNLGEYNIEIKSCRLAKDYSGKDVVIVKYIFSNVSDDSAASFSGTINDQVYQNGVGLNNAYFLDDSANYSTDNQTKDIKKGASIEVEVAYELNDTTTSIEVEVKEFFSLNDTVVTKIFSFT